MSYGAGIDLGTTFTSAAVSASGRTRMVPLSPDLIVPSVAFQTTGTGLFTGAAAAQAAETDPVGVARSFKRRLGDPSPLVLRGRSHSAAALMAAQLRDVLAEIAGHMGGPPESIVLTCPAIWGPYRRRHFAEVPRLAGVQSFRMITEPEAAATHYTAERRLGDGEVVAVYDLGGGTFDTTILRMCWGGTEILGTPEGVEHMGGIDFDDTLQAHVDDRLDGAVSDLDPADPTALAALAQIRAECVRAKEDLSVEQIVTLTVPLPSGRQEVTVTREQFEDMIRPSVQLTIEAMRRTISSAGLSTDKLSAVLLTGGSSRIPLVSHLVSEEFGKPVRVTLHPKFTVALGAAAIAAGPAVAVPAPVVPQPAPVAAPDPVVTMAAVPAAAPATNRRWLVLAAAVLAVVVVIAVALALAA
ncbi:MAG: Hsp70 family protein [Kibdelosporangium sp.]